MKFYIISPNVEMEQFNPEILEEISEIIHDTECSLTPLGPTTFDSTSGEKRLKNHYQVQTLEGFANFERVEIAALGAIVDYLDITQKGKLPFLQPPIQQSTLQIMQIDAATRRNLEITQALSGGRKGTLLSTIDKTLCTRKPCWISHVG